jgi:plastocyanin
MADTSKINEILPKLGLLAVVLSIVFTLWLVFVWREPVSETEQLPTPTIIQPTNTPVPTPTSAQEPDENITPTAAVTVSPTPTVMVNVPETLEDELIDRQIVVEAVEYSFKVGGSSGVRAGETVRILFQNNGEKVHNLTIDELGVTTGDIEPGDTISIDIEIPVNDKQQYAFYCSLDNNRDLGMEGRLIVTQ